MYKETKKKGLKENEPLKLEFKKILNPLIPDEMQLRQKAENYL